MRWDGMGRAGQGRAGRARSGLDFVMLSLLYVSEILGSG
jgi:hypothetical protein